MPEPSVHTVQLHDWLDRIRAGDRAARDELLRGVCNRLERLARKMLGRFPSVRGWVDTGDVLQNSLLRLMRALQDVRPASMREFFGLAAEQMRRELLDLARHYHGPLGEARHRAATPAAEDSQAPAVDPPNRTDDSDLENWCSFHQEVERLPVEEREVIGLVFYHGWTQAQVAELFGVTERTVRRRWEAAMVKLRRTLVGIMDPRRTPT